jgi:hypothetical protein
MGMAVGLAAGILEEIGWTGFAIPRMRLRYWTLGFVYAAAKWVIVGAIAIVNGGHLPRQPSRRQVESSMTVLQS